MQQRVRLFSRSTVAAALLAVAGGAVAQVTPAEPFGGRPFGASSATPPPQAQAQAAAPAQAPAPVVVQPGTSPVVVQAAPPVVVPPPAPTVNSTRPTSSVNPMPLPGGAAQGTAPPAASMPQGGSTASTPAEAPQGTAPVTPPFTSNRNAPPGTAPATAASQQQQQQPVRGLPADAPRLVVTGAVWSADRNKRMLIVNGQPVREGADVGSGVVVESVHREGAVLGFRGNRYAVWF